MHQIKPLLGNMIRGSWKTPQTLTARDTENHKLNHEWPAQRRNIRHRASYPENGSQHNFNINPFMPNGLFYLHTSDRSISSIRDVWLILIITIFNPLFYANSVDPDQTPHSAASDLGLHCLPISLLWDARHKWVKEYILPCDKQRMIMISTSIEVSV